MSSLTTLPDDALKLVMQRVPFKDRLTSCCLVSKRLHAAAVAATQDLQLGRQQPTDAKSAMQGVSHYGQHLTSLFVGGPRWPLQQLCCPNLQELRVHFCNVLSAVAMDGQPHIHQDCTKLTRLQMIFDMRGAPEGAELDSLSSLVHLQHLEIMPI
jgi:hypothetical protein